MRCHLPCSTQLTGMSSFDLATMIMVMIESGAISVSMPNAEPATLQAAGSGIGQAIAEHFAGRRARITTRLGG